MTDEFSARYGPWALVLGASNGIGASFARQIGMLPRQGSWPDRAMLRLFNLKTWLSRPFNRARRT